jgi:hypothetical protein
MTPTRSAPASGSEADCVENPGIKIVRTIKVDPRDSSLFEHLQVVASREAWDRCEERKEPWDILEAEDIIVASRIVFPVLAN